MIQKRDIFIGIGILAVLVLIVVFALAVLSAALVDDLVVVEDSVGVVDITGPIITPDAAVKQIERFAGEKRIPVIVIRLNTPGGGVSATQEIFEAVRKAREDGKIVIASMGTVAASGGYYIAAACDTIMATPGTITGSIGVIARYPNLSGLYEKVGVDFNTIKSGKFKDTGSSSREMTEEEREYLDSVIMDTYDQFVTAVAEERGIALDKLKEIADGRIFTGRQAVELNLVDRLGTFRDAIELAGAVSGIGADPPIVRKSGHEYLDLLSEGMLKLISSEFELHIPAVSYIMRF